ncbi:GAP1-N2 domain-containing protein [Arthrobacter zhaoxinii]|uniref:GAP1-N2 domain-containing protein n=1 Tax=Arthrobacter zhaoxinii TaxID=2964616 RepID=UPI0021050521|nr:hypothetical protein [Arthrobacter zhaoxinii]MCQ2001132.1 hypothetical protein [Arthrobacter zhaoxinii]
MAFESSIYTDVRAGEAVDGVDGFNFQSVSPGIDGADQKAIRELMLHQISTQWPMEREDRDHPPSAAFMQRDGRFYFSRGLSTGTTENGRRGNQLTQAVVTKSAEDIRPYRPAQILAAVNWNLEKADSTTCEPWFAPLELSSGFEADVLLSWLRSDTWVQQVLPEFLTMLESATGESPQKVILIHDDLQVVLRWMALGTLLLDAQAADRLELRAFVTDPYQTSAGLVGMHPDLMRGPVSGAHTINILERTISGIDPSDSARLVLDWALRLETFDALEVIDIAQRWMPAIGVRYGAAGAEVVTGTRTARVGREEWDLGVSIIEGLASNGLRSDLELYLDELAEAVSSYQLQSAEDFARAARATRFAAESGIPGLAEALLAPTFESLAAAPEFSLTWVQEINPDGAWVWPQLDAPESLVENLTQVIREAPAPALSPLLVLVQPLTGLLPADKLVPAIDRAAAYLRRNSRSMRELDGWYGAPRARTTLREQLVNEIDAVDSASVSAAFEELRAGTWDSLDPTDEPLTGASLRFLPWLDAARVARAAVDKREALLRTAGMRPGPESWRRVLSADTQLPKDADLWAAWVETVGASSNMQQYIKAQVEGILRQEPKEANARETRRWLPLVETLSAKYPRDSELETAVADLDAFIESIPSLKERASDAGSKVKGMFTRRSKEE